LKLKRALAILCSSHSSSLPRVVCRQTHYAKVDEAVCFLARIRRLKGAAGVSRYAERDLG
jgi:hypothetical protein